MKIIIPVISILFLASCSHKIIQTTKTIEKDSMRVDTVKTQKVVKTKGDSVGMVFKLPVLGTSAGQIVYPESHGKAPGEVFYLKSEDSIVFKKTEKRGRLTESVTISKKGNVVITCKEDSLKEIIEQQRITIQKFKNVTTTETKTVVCPPKTEWEKFCEWWTWICIATLIGATAYRFRKYIPYLKWIP